MVKEPFGETRELMGRAIRRLNVLSYLMTAAALIFALAGGALAAWLLNVGAGFPFGLTWVVASILLFVLPAAAVFGRELRAGRSLPGDPPAAGHRPGTDANHDADASEIDGRR